MYVEEYRLYLKYQRRSIPTTGIVNDEVTRCVLLDQPTSRSYEPHYLETNITYNVKHTH